MLHKDLTIEKWNSRGFAFQMGSVGAEVARMTNFLKKQDREAAEKCLDRALELLDLTIAGSKSKKEPLRLRETMCGLFYSPGAYEINPDQFNNYFLPFAVLARKK